jgi:hypothetical protein
MRFGWFIALPLLFVALLAGSCGYAMGVSSAAVAPAAGVAVHPMWGFGFFPFFGFIFFLVVIFAIVGAFKRRAWGGGYGPRSGYGPGRGYGYGPGRSSSKTYTNDQFEEWHRRMHGEPARPQSPNSPQDPNIPDDTLNAPWDPPTPPKDENTQL